MVLAKQFGKAVSWLFDADAQKETAWNVGLKLDRLLTRLFHDEAKEQAGLARRRQNLIHDMASHAVVCTWDRPLEMQQFIRDETPPLGYLYGVTADDVIEYSQNHFRELLPKRTHPEAQAHLDSLKTGQNPYSTLEPG